MWSHNKKWRGKCVLKPMFDPLEMRSISFAGRYSVRGRVSMVWVVAFGGWMVLVGIHDGSCGLVYIE